MTNRVWEAQCTGMTLEERFHHEAGESGRRIKKILERHLLGSEMILLVLVVCLSATLHDTTSKKTQTKGIPDKQ